MAQPQLHAEHFNSETPDTTIPRPLDSVSQSSSSSNMSMLPVPLQQDVESRRMAASSAGNDDDERINKRADRERQMLSADMARAILERSTQDDDDNENGFSLTKYPVREIQFSFPCRLSGPPVAVNPVVTLIGVVSLWSIVIWCSADRTNALATLAEWRHYISLSTTWLIQGSKAIFLFFVGYLWYQYGDIHLGNKNDKPEFPTVTYASMILTAGAGNGLLVYSVFEPLLNRKFHYYANAGYRSQDEIDMFAINMTVVGWGLSGWAPYAIVAIAMSLAVYRFQLPMTLRSCFYPILGHYTWGWMGDFIDGFTVFFTLAGIFTSLGVVPMSLTAGLAYLGWINGATNADHVSAIEHTTIVVVTIISLVTAVAGLHVGIRWLCMLTMAISCLLMVFVFLHDDSKFLLNLQVQTVGYYLQTSLFQLNFWTDAFGQLREGSGRAVDGNAAKQDWMESSLNYIMAWCISRGRKVWEVCVYSVLVPAGFCLVWFCVWGGVGLRHVRQATELKRLGETLFNNSGHFLANGTDLCYEVPQGEISIGDKVVFTNYLPGVSPVCDYDANDENSAVYHVLHSFGTGRANFFGPTLSFFFMLGCVLFHVIGACAAALFVDKLTSSGRKSSRMPRRVFWTISVGALASVLFTAGGGDSHANIRAAMIICGLPCAVIVCYMMQPVLLMCAAAEAAKATELDTLDYPFPDQPEFSMPIYGGIFNSLEYLTSAGRVNAVRKEMGIHQPTQFQVIEFTKGLLVPFVSLYQILSETYPHNRASNASLAALFAVCYIGWFGAWVASFVHPGVNGGKWVLFVLNGFILTLIRYNFRTKYNLRSNAVGDIVSSLFLWPQVLAQMRLHCAIQEVHHEPPASELPTKKTATSTNMVADPP